MRRHRTTRCRPTRNRCRIRPRFERHPNNSAADTYRLPPTTNHRHRSCSRRRFDISGRPSTERNSSPRSRRRFRRRSGSNRRRSASDRRLARRRRRPFDSPTPLGSPLPSNRDHTTRHNRCRSRCRFESRPNRSEQCRCPPDSVVTGSPNRRHSRRPPNRGRRSSRRNRCRSPHHFVRHPRTRGRDTSRLDIRSIGSRRPRGRTCQTCTPRTLRLRSRRRSPSRCVRRPSTSGEHTSRRDRRRSGNRLPPHRARRLDNRGGNSALHRARHRAFEFRPRRLRRPMAPKTPTRLCHPDVTSQWHPRDRPASSNHCDRRTPTVSSPPNCIVRHRAWSRTSNPSPCRAKA
jgi:hypothetical protein